MKKTVLTFGLIGGAIMATMMFATMPFVDKTSGSRSGTCKRSRSSSRRITNLRSSESDGGWHSTLSGGALNFANLQTNDCPLRNLQICST
jgi:hypothetical protein